MKKLYIVTDKSAGPVGYYSSKEKAEEGAKKYHNLLESYAGDGQTFEQARKFWLSIEEEVMDQDE